jgi:hypothetical protein
MSMLLLNNRIFDKDSHIKIDLNKQLPTFFFDLKNMFD